MNDSLIIDNKNELEDKINYYRELRRRRIQLEKNLDFQPNSNLYSINYSKPRKDLLDINVSFTEKKEYLTKKIQKEESDLITDIISKNLLKDIYLKIEPEVEENTRFFEIENRWAINFKYISLNQINLFNVPEFLKDNLKLKQEENLNQLNNFKKKRESIENIISTGEILLPSIIGIGTGLAAYSIGAEYGVKASSYLNNISPLFAPISGFIDFSSSIGVGVVSGFTCFDISKYLLYKTPKKILYNEFDNKSKKITGIGLDNSINFLNRILKNPNNYKD